jgi:hypothetical protein
LLWYATSRAVYAQRASSVEMIAERMTRLSNRVLGRSVNVATSTASYLIEDCRRRKFAYGWMILHAQKGQVGYNRGYVTALCDLTDEDEEVYLFDAADLSFGISGLISSLKTSESMVKNDADGMELAVATLEAMGDTAMANKLRPISTRLPGLAGMITAIRRDVEAL